MVSIYICKGLFGKVRIVNAERLDELWSGKSGETAEFNIENEERIGIAWGFFNKINVEETVCAGKHYELIFRMNTFGAKYYLIEI